ncbi:MAG: ABC transporter permease, partial [Planctomycetaceae bacterium]|nr:ABC transporter permease [Planctomycetaceae bacterium]
MSKEYPPPGNPLPVDGTPGVAEPLAAEPETVVPHSAESQWSLVWKEFRQRRLALFCAVLVVLLATVAIFAPFLANDRPLYYVGVNRFQYVEAARTARVMLASVINRKTSEGAAAGEASTSDAGNTARQDPVDVIRLQLEIMGDELAGSEREQFDVLREEILTTARQVADGAAEPDQLAELRARLRKEFDAREVTLAIAGHWPVLATLNWLDIAFMVGNLLILTLPLWRFGLNRCIPPGKPGLRSTAVTGVLFGLPVLLAAAWWVIVPERIDRTPYKTGVLITEGEDAKQAEVAYVGVVWPPVPYGLDEGNLGTIFEEPAWWPEDTEETSEEAARRTDKTAAARGPWDTIHWMGTDEIGRDLFCRMIWGGRVSLSVGIVAVSIYVSLGILIGSIAGYFRGYTDLVISRIIEVVICFPSFFLILAIVAFVGPSMLVIMVVIGLTSWTGVARLVRAEFLRLSGQEFVLAGRVLGYSPLRLIFRHVLPNAMAPVLVSATFGVAGAILTESALSFLGLGITVPKPSWGGILSDGRDAIFSGEWIIIFPGLAI